MRWRRRPGPANMWTRAKMLALLAAVAATVLAAVAGLVVIAVSALHPADHSSPAGTTVAVSTGSEGEGTPAAGGNAGPGRSSAAGGTAEDAVADRALPNVDPQAAQPAPVSLTPPGTIIVPTANRVAAAGVATGFPRTPEGALAQLAAIDVAALESGSLAGARAVLAGWAAPGGPTGQSWSLIRGLAELLDQAGLSGGGSPRLALVLTPMMGLVKGSVGADFSVPCVDFELDVTLNQSARAAVADCQRMVWTAGPGGSGRWVIGPGREPATAPSVWPDTDTAIAVGYRDLRAADHG